MKLRITSNIEFSSGRKVTETALLTVATGKSVENEIGCAQEIVSAFITRSNCWNPERAEFKIEQIAEY